MRPRREIRLGPLKTIPQLYDTPAACNGGLSHGPLVPCFARTEHPAAAPRGLFVLLGAELLV